MRLWETHSLYDLSPGTQLFPRAWCVCAVECKVNMFRYTPCSHQGERKYSCYTFLISTLDGVGSVKPGRALPPEWIPGIHWIEGWVGLRDALGKQARKNPLPGIKPRSYSFVIRYKTE
jgi:hypothetical protein